MTSNTTSGWIVGKVDTTELTEDFNWIHFDTETATASGALINTNKTIKWIDFEPYKRVQPQNPLYPQPLNPPRPHQHEPVIRGPYVRQHPLHWGYPEIDEEVAEGIEELAEELRYQKVEPKQEPNRDPDEYLKQELDKAPNMRFKDVREALETRGSQLEYNVLEEQWYLVWKRNGNYSFRVELPKTFIGDTFMNDQDYKTYVRNGKVLIHRDRLRGNVV